MNTIFSRTWFLFASSALALSSWATPAKAQTFNQLGGGSFAWNNSTFWTPATVPGVAGDTATFDSITVATTVNLDDGTTAFNPILGNLVFNATNTAAITIAPGVGGSLTFNNNALASTINVGTGNSVSITAGIAVAAVGLNVTNNGTLGLDAVNNGGFALTVNGSGGTTIGGALTSAGLVTYSGTGSLTLSGTNTNSGGVTLNSGTLNLNSATALGAATGTFTVAGGTIDTAAANTLTNNNPIAITGSFAFTGTANLNLGSGNVTVASAPTITANASTLTLGGVVSGGGLTALDIVKAGNGTLALTNTNAITIAAPQTLTVNAGTTTLTAAINNGTFDLTKVGAGNYTISGVVGNGTGGIVVNGGLLQLNGVNTFTGLVSVNAGGTVSVNADSGLGAAPGAAATAVVIDGGTLQQTANFNITANRQIAIGLGGATFNNASTGNFNVQSVIKDNVVGAGSLTVTGTGLYVPASQSTYSGGTHLMTGISAVVNSNSTGSASTANLVSGPFGTGILYFDGGSTRASTGASQVIGNALQINANIDFVAAGTTNTLTFTGPVTLTGNRTFNQLSTAGNGTDVFTGVIGDGGSGFGITKTGTGTILFSGNNTFTGGTVVTAGTLQGNITTGVNVFGIGGTITLNGGNVTLLADGDGGTALTGGNGTGQLQNIALSNPLSVQATGTLTVNRLGNTYAPLFTTALNKTIQFPSLSIGAFNLTVTNTSQYGVEITGNTTMTGAPTFTVSTATASDINPGLKFSGAITGDFAITKGGAGTMILSNASNAFTGNFTVTGGVLGATSDAALGNTANTITLNGASAGFEAFGTFTTNRSFTFLNAAPANNLLLVSSGNTLTITSQLTGANGFQKGDPGILILNNSASNITGPITVSGGVLRITDANALGTTSAVTVAANEGTAFQLSGGINFARPITLAGSTGILNNGQIENFSGSNTVSSAITLGAAATIGNSAAGTTLSLTGGVSGAFGLTFNGIGNTAVTTTAIGAVTGLVRNSSGTTTVSVASPLFVSAIGVNQGTLALNGAGAFGAAAVATTVGANGTFWLDNSGTATSNRLGGATTPRTMVLTNGTFRYTASSASANTESTGAFTANWGNDTVLIETTAQPTTITMASFPVVGGGGTAVFTTGGTNANFGSASNAFITTAAPAGLTGGIIQRAIVIDGNGVNFATGAAGASISAYTAYNATNNLVAALATDNPRLTASASIFTSRTLNALASNGAITLDSPAGFGTLTLTAANVLVQSGTLTQSSNLAIAGAGVELGINVAAGATYNVNGTFTSSNNMTKGLDGTLNFNSRQYSNTGTNYLTINGGTVKLAGGDNTLFPGQVVGSNQNLAVGPGATLDLNGNVQVVGGLNNPNTNAFGGAGGSVISTGGAAVLVIRQPNLNWSGVISGPVTFTMGNTALANVERFYNDNTYTGRTGIFGGTLELTDGGRLSATSAIDINYGSLTVTNSSANNGRFNLADRVNDAATITMSGGALFLTGRVQTAVAETLGNVVLARGNSQLNLSTGGTGINSSDFTFTSITQSSLDGVTNVQSASGQLGSTTRLFFGNGLSLVNNNILPVWIESGGGDYMTYIAGHGAMALNANGAPGYTGAALPTVNNAAANVGNYKITANGVVPTGGLTINTLNVNGAFNVTFGTTTSTDVLNLVMGGLMKSASATVSLIGSVAGEGRLTAGGTASSGTVALVLSNGQAASPSLTINSQIIDNPNGAAVRLVIQHYNGGFTSLANPNNSYTGGTSVNGWVNNNGGGLTLGVAGVIPAGGLTINNSNVISTVAGTVNAANTVTLTGGSVFTLVGANTLAGLAFNNLGGATAATVNTGGVLTLTGTISALSNSVSTLPVVNGTIDFGGTARTLSIAPIAYNSRTLTALQPTLNIAGVIQNAGLISVTGGGRLQLSGQSTFTGGVSVDATSGIVLGASSTPSTPGATLTSGPLGTGSLTAASGATFLSTAAQTVANPFIAQGDLNFDGINNITFNSTTTLPGTLSVSVAAPQQTVTFNGSVAAPATSLTKTGYGTLALPVAAVSTAGSITLVNGALSLLADGDGTGTPQGIAAAGITSASGLNLIVGRSASAFFPYYQLAANKTIQVASLTFTGGVNVTNNNGYGLEATGGTTLTADSIFGVANATNSNVIQGLTLSGVVSGSGGIVKVGPGALALTNAGNTFGGAGKLIDIQAGIVSVPNDGALGNSSNVVRINTNAATAAGFRATGTFTSPRTFTLNQAANAIEVSGGNILTLSSPFSIPTATNTLTKNDIGILEITANNGTTWTGAVTINAGALRLSNSAALGTLGSITIPGVAGAAVQLAGNVTIPNGLILNNSTTNQVQGGINFGGQLQNVSGTNATAGVLTLNADIAIGSDAGSTLNINGTINNPTTTTRAIAFNVAGTINVNSSITAATATANQYFALQKYGPGTLNFTTAQPTVFATGSTQNFTAFAGTMRFTLSGTVAASTAIGLTVAPGSTVTLDNNFDNSGGSAGSGTVVANRLGGRAVIFQGGTFNLLGGSTATTETLGAPTFSRGQSIITVTDGGAGTNLTFSATNNAVNPAQTTGGSGATVLFRGTSLGSAAGPGVATITNAGGFTTNGATGITGATSKSILPWAVIDTTATGLGFSFATSDIATAGGVTTANAVLRPLAAGEYGSGALTAGLNMLVTTALTGQATVAPNSITIDTGGSIALGSTAGIGNSLTLSSGGILVRNGVATTLSGGIASLVAANSAWNIHTIGTGSLTISSLMNGGNANTTVGLVKAGGGTLTLSTPTQTIGGLTTLSANSLLLQTAVNQGTLVLNGGTNVLGTNNLLSVGAGGTVDLNGNVQTLLAIVTDGAVTGVNGAPAGGTITNSAVSQATLVTNSDARNWAGTIAGNVFYNRSGSVTTTTVYTPQTYTGGTLVNGGTLSLRDYATLSGTSGIDLNYATLQLDNTGTNDLAGRLNSAATITMRGGIFIYLGRAQTASAETVGPISLAEGWNVVDSRAGGTNINSAVLTAASLTRPAGSTAVVQLNQASGTADYNGQIGSTGRFLLSSVTLTNNLIGPWAVSTREWASYIPDLGVGQLNTTGFAGYAVTSLATGAPTDNIRLTAAPATLTANSTVNTLNLITGATTVVNLGGFQLNVVGGGILNSTVTGTQTFQNGTITSGYANGLVNDLYIHHLPYAGTSRFLVISAGIVNNGATPVRFVLSNTEIPVQSLTAASTVQTTNVAILTGANTYTGGTVLNGGNTIVANGATLPAGGITLNSATLGEAFGNTVGSANVAGNIDAANVVTLNGPSTLALVNNSTLAGLVFNNTGATAAGAAATSVNLNPLVSTFIPGMGTTGTGTLTIGASGIVANSSNVATTALIQGRIDTGAGSTWTINPITVNGAAVAPLQPTLAIQGIAGTGDITKAGNGILQFNSMTVNTGTINVTAGGIGFASGVNGGLNPAGSFGPRLATVNLSANTFINMTNTDMIIGGLAGSGTVFNVNTTGVLPTARTFNFGSNNADTAFSGIFSRYNDASLTAYQVNKIGTGTFTFSGSSSTVGVNTTALGMQVSQGTWLYNGAGNTTFSTAIILPTATLTLDNSGTNVNNRLGSAIQLGTTATATILSITGGTLRILGNASVPTTEAVGTFSFSGSVPSNPNGKGVVSLEANAAQSLTFSVTSFAGVLQGSTGLIRGLSNTTGAGQANFSLGAVALTGAVGGAGLNGTTTMSIRADILGDASIAGNGTAFLVKDTTSNFLRPLATSELATTVIPGNTANSTVNYGLTTAGSLYGAGTTVNSLTLGAGGSLVLAAGISTASIDGLPMNFTLNSGGLLVQSAQTNIGVGRITTTSNAPFFFHTQANTAINGVLTATTGGLSKDGAGSLTLNARSLMAAQTNVLEGTLVLNGGDNTLYAPQTAGVPTIQALGINGGTVDLNGTNQLVGTFFNNGNQRYAGGAGILTNSSITTSTFTTSPGTAFATAVSVQGNLNFTKAGATNLTLVSNNTYTGVTNVRGATLTLVDSGVLANTSAVNVNYATLAIDQSSLNPIGSVSPQRTPATAPINLRGGTYSFTAGGSADYTQTINTVNAVQGHSTVSVPQAPVGSSAAVTIGNLVVDPDATINLTGAAGGFFSNLSGLNQSQLFINQINGVAVSTLIAANKNLGGNILANNGEFATYVTSATAGSNGVNYGVITMNGTTGPLAAITQVAYDATAITAAGTAATNVRITASGTLVSGGTTYNSLSVRAASTAAAITVTFTAATDVLNINSGGISFTNTVASLFGSAADSGRLTAGGTQSTGVARLYFTSGGVTGHTLNSRIVDNPNGAKLRFVPNVLSGLTLNVGGVNSYTGGTVLNGTGTLAVTAAGFIPAGGITINNSTLTQTTSANSATTGLAPANDVTINGGGVLTLGAFANTLNSLTFNNNGGTATPTVTIGTVSLTLTGPSTITAVNDNLATVPTIAGTSLVLPATATITTSTTANVPTNLVISAPISGSTTLTKAGTGSLLLSGANTFAGTFNLDAGAVILGNAAAFGTAAVNMADGTALLSDTAVRILTNNFTLNGNVTFGSSAGNSFADAIAVNGVTINGTVALGGTVRQINVNSYLNSSTLGGAVSGTGGLTKTGPGTLVLSADNTAGYSGITSINGGVLSATVAGSLGSNTATGAVVFGGGILQHGGTNLTDYSGRFSTASNLPIYIDTVANNVTYATALTSTGGSIGKFGTGSLILQAAPQVDGLLLVNQGTLQIGTGNTSTGTLLSLYGNVLDAGTFFLNRLSADVMNTGSITGSGNVTINQGKLAPNGAFNIGGNVLYGNVAGTTPITTVGSLDLTNATAASVVTGTFIAQTDTQANTGLTNSVIIPTGKTLSVTGNVTVGFNTGLAAGLATSRTVLTMTGGGSFIVNGPAAVVAVGVGESAQATTGTNNILDLSALGTVNLGTVAAPITTVNVGFGQTTSGRLLLATGAGSVNTIDATTLNVGNSNGANGFVPTGGNTMVLGTGTNTINADTINIGFSKVPGFVTFASQASGSPGTLTINNKAGSGAANITIGSNNGTNTAAVIGASAASLPVLDVRGHNSTLVFGTMTLGLGNSPGAGAASGAFRFDTGTTTIATLSIGSRTGATTVDTTAISSLYEIGGGTASVSGATTIATNATTAQVGSVTGTISVIGGTANFTTISGANRSGGGTGAATANINVSGGALNVTGASFVLATQATAGTAAGTLNITGGIVTSSADITDGGGTATTTVTLNGGTLDMTGKSIGLTGALIDTLNFQAGTLQNVLEINNGANFVKTTGGTLDMRGVNGYTGQTQVQAGTLTFLTVNSVGGGSSSLGAPTTVGNGTIAIGNAATSATLQFLGSVSQTTDRVIDLAGTTGGATLDASGTGATITYSNPAGITASGIGSKTLTLAGTNTGANTLAAAIVDNSVGNTTSLAKSGPGLWVLSGTSTYTGTTAVNAGELRVNGNNTAANGATTVAATGTLSGASGTLGGNVTVNDGGFIRGGAGTTIGTLNIVGNTSIATGTTGGTLQTIVSRTGVGTANTGMLNVTGLASTLDLNTGGTGKFTISLLNFGNTSLVVGETYTIPLGQVATAGNITLNGTPQPASTVIPQTNYFATLDNGGTLDPGYSLSTDSTGTVLQLTFTPTAVPEPATLLGLAAAGLGIAGWVRRRRTKG